jgi:hypothetical protein
MHRDVAQTVYGLMLRFGPASIIRACYLSLKGCAIEARLPAPHAGCILVSSLRSFTPSDRHVPHLLMYHSHEGPQQEL